MDKPTKIEIAKALRVKQRIKAKTDYLSYLQYTVEEFEPLPHTLLLAKEIQHLIDERERMLSKEIPTTTQYLMISMPPRHGKSMTITESLPGYMAARYNRFKVIMTAYSSTLADDFARENTNKLERTPIFDVKVKTNNQERVLLSNGSIIVKAGIMGGITGKGANLILIDDPIKTEEEARSETTRNKVWREWISSLSSRLEPPAIVILIMTRWHEDDLAGRMLNPEYGEPLPWKVINLPLEAEEDDILGREVGEPLWPDKYGHDFIQQRKQDPRSFNALYQGRPTSDEGNIIKREWWKFYDKRDDFVNTLPVLVLSVDATFKDTAKSDNVALQVWGKKGAYFYLVDDDTRRMDFTTTLVAIENICRKYPRISRKLVEDKANGSAIINVLNKKIGGFTPVNPQGGKESRAYAVTPYIESGNVLLPRGEHFVHEFIEECAAFPTGKRDDRVDGMTQAISQMLYYYGGVQKGSYDVTSDFFGDRKADENKDAWVSQDAFNWG